jgi:hypothetical protein
VLALKRAAIEGLEMQGETTVVGVVGSGHLLLASCWILLGLIFNPGRNMFL